MGGRKENVKKSLEMSDYPWSSDDEDDMPQDKEILPLSRRVPRTSIDDMPGTSGISGTGPPSSQPSPATARKNQAKADRKFFWSIINNTPTELLHSRRKPEELKQMKRITIRPREELLGALDAHRLVEFKNLTRSLQNLEQTLATSNTAQPSSSYSVPRVSAGSPPPVSRTESSTSSTARTTFSSRPLVSTCYSTPIMSRITATPGHAVPLFSRNVTTNHSRHPYLRPAATTGHNAHTRSAASTGHGAYPHLKTGISAGRNAPPISRITPSINRPAPSSAWSAGSTSQAIPSSSRAPASTFHVAPSSSWAAASTNYANPSSSWATTSNGQIYSSWPRLNPPTMPQMATFAPPAFQPGQGNNDGAQWTLPPNHRELWDNVTRIIPLEWLNEDMRRELGRAIRSFCELYPSNTGFIENPAIETEIGIDPQDRLERQRPRQTTAPVIPKTEPVEENVENPRENAEAEMSTHNTTGATLLEEVVEVAISHEENVPPGTGDDEVDDPTGENTTNVAAVLADLNANGMADATGQASPYQGLKRKRDSTDDSRQSFSIHDFNQNLLRLLECPVCLEWMEPPISQCRRGHLVCSRCRSRLNSCPVCRTPFSSVRNRAMEGVAEMLRYPCRHGCGREVRMRRRGPHEASCAARRYQCPAPDCTRHPPLQRDELAHHFQCKHLPILKIGRKHKFSMKVNAEQHDTWLIMALDEYFHLQVDVDIRTWGVVVYVSYIGPKKNADQFYYEVTVQGQHNSRRLVYTRTTHSDLESSSVNVSRQDCFHLTLDQALNFLRLKNRHCEPDKFLDFDVELTKIETTEEPREDTE